ncbi:hypothetical protein OG897_31315 [Streptomyces sp. NBC_00237]|uniref:hypothetical protein n=1 Tax=Streptomyces sp. NBC_00237 TaxID=2975687 RepID=UPI00225944C5|nr:hypothetical protein [Streptomyces sp. NBC_00237]MCX5205906.1 hypothetical protein [Streptomyces sp. NBC_00237]
MRRIDLSTPAGQPSRPRLRRRLAFTLAGALAAAAAMGGVTLYDRTTSGPFGSSTLASWTTSPTHVDTSTGPGAATLKWCLNTMPGDSGPIKVTNADLRGKVTSMIVSRGDTTTLCYVASKNGGFSASVSTAQTIAPEAISYDTSGSHGDAPDVFSYAAGFAGSHVKAVTMTALGRTFEVTVEDGRWTAWWPSAVGGRDSSRIDTVTLTLTDGTTRTGTASSLILPTPTPTPSPSNSPKEPTATPPSPPSSSAS